MPTAHAGLVRDVRALRQLLAERYPDARPLVERDAAHVAPPVVVGG